jgi:DNA-binding MltR family transcriptional regulator
MFIAIIAILLAGIANFAMHRAFVESDDPVVQAMIRPFLDRMGPYFTYGIEFIMLFGALVLAQRSWFAGLALYGLYTIFNAAAFAWITNRPK